MGRLQSYAILHGLCFSLAKVVQGLYSLAIYISYGLQGFVPIDIMWNTYLAHMFQNSKFIKLWEYGLRSFTVLITCQYSICCLPQNSFSSKYCLVVLAISIPLLGLFISLFGAFCLSALGIAFPAIMEICVKWPNQLGCMKWILVKNVILIIIGICGLLAGSYSALSEIIIKLSSGETN